MGQVGVAVGLVYGTTLTTIGWRVWRLRGMAESRPNCHPELYMIQVPTPTVPSRQRDPNPSGFAA